MLMMGWTPKIRVTVNGREVAGLFYSRLIKATIRDEAGQSSDTCTIELDDAGNAIEAPSKDDDLTVELGFLETGIVNIGVFKVQSVELNGSTGDGERMTIQAKAADLKKKLKGEGNESHRDKTFGQIVNEAAGRAGLQAVVDSSLASIQFPYKARVGQSEIDFITRLADEVGGVVKPAAGKLIVTKRGSGKTAGGKDVPPILIDRADCKEWSASPEGRPQFGRVVAPYVDQKSGKRKIETSQTGLQGPDFVVRELAPTQARAKRQSQAEAQRLNRNTGSCSFTIAGRPTASAEATIITNGFRPEINGSWRCSSVEHEFTSGSGGGFITKIEGKALEDGKKGGIKDG